MGNDVRLTSKYEAFIFDFDGVIVDTEPGFFSVLQRVVKGQGVMIPDHAFFKKVGRTSVAFLSEFLLSAGYDKDVHALLEPVYREFLQNLGKYISPIHSTVNFIKGYQGGLHLAVASMSTRSFIERVSKMFGILEKWDLIVSRENVNKHKPDPEIYKLAAKRLGVEPNRCVVFEDSPVGVESGKRAGMSVFVVINSVNGDWKFPKVDGFVYKVQDIEKILG